MDIYGALHVSRQGRLLSIAACLTTRSLPRVAASGTVSRRARFLCSFVALHHLHRAPHSLGALHCMVRRHGGGEVDRASCVDAGACSEAAITKWQAIEHADSADHVGSGNVRGTGTR